MLGPTVARGLAGRVLRPAPTRAGRISSARPSSSSVPPSASSARCCRRGPILAPEYVEELARLQVVGPADERSRGRGGDGAGARRPVGGRVRAIDPHPLAAGTIGQVHRATLADGRRVVVKVQRPARPRSSTRTWRCSSVVRPSRRGRMRRVIDLPSVVDQLGTSLRAELDFRREAQNLDRMAEILEALRPPRGAALSPRPLDAPPARDGRGRRRGPGRRRAPGSRTHRGGPPAPPGLLPAGARGRLLPRRPPSRQPHVGRRLHLADRPRHGRPPRRRDAPAAHAAPARVRTG